MTASAASENGEPFLVLAEPQLFVGDTNLP
jgi:hypothetical protein